MSQADLSVGTDHRARCGWVGADLEYQRYHDEEWGNPLKGDRALFEKLSLEGFQAGLSWITILRRRSAFREAFAEFEPSIVSGFGASDVERLLTDPGIIRNRAKIEATISNAKLVVEMGANNPGAFSDLLWSYAPTGQRDRPRSLHEIAAATAQSIALSKHLKNIGFRFVGPTTLHAMMQSTGMLDDHLVGCWRAVP